MTESWRNEMNANAKSGSELMMLGLERELGKEFLEDFQIILSRPRELDENKIRIFWAHDLPEDGESIKALENNGWKKFHRFVFVSNWQQQQYIQRFGIPWSRCVVMINAILDIDTDIDAKFAEAVNGTIRFVYHTTPHRGLGLLVPVFEQLASIHPDIHLDVYSSFKLYGWEDADKQFEPLFDAVRKHDNMTYHGAVENSVVRDALSKAHVFAYPSCWTETSCIALIEAMSAGCVCIHPNNGALFETASSWTFMYPYHEDHNQHAHTHFQMLSHAVDIIKEGNVGLHQKLSGQKSFADINFNWKVRAEEWKNFLNSLRDLPRGIEDTGPTWKYSVDV